MTQGGHDERDSIRIDRLLVYLRFARTRSVARAMIDSHALRLNRQHIRRPSENVSIGDVLTLVQSGEVKIVEVLSLPGRRASPSAAKQFYREVARS